MRIKCQKTFLAGALAVSLASLQAQAALTHRYSFEETQWNATTTADAIGGAAGLGAVHGTNYSFSGTGQLGFNVSGAAATSSANVNGDYVSFPTNVLAGATNVTFDFWFHSGNSIVTAAGTWSRVFDFGSTSGGSGTTYAFFSTHNWGNYCQFTLRDKNVGEQSIIAGPALDSGDFHVTCVFDSATHYMEIYSNGVQVARGAIDTNLTLTNINYQGLWLGRSQYTGDPYFTGSIDEFRIYNNAMSAPEVMASHLAGQTNASATVDSQLGSISALGFLQGGTNVTGISLMERTGGSVTPAANFQLGSAPYLPLFRYPGVTLTSSDTNTVTVDSNGGIYAKKPGVVTLTASLNNMNGTLSVTVTNDSTAPTVTSASNAGYETVMNIIFSKPVDTNSAQNVANYSIDGGAIAVKSATLLPGNTVRLYTAHFDETVSHSITISGVNDLAFQPNTVVSTNFTFGLNVTVPANGMTWKIWTNITSFSNWKASAVFPNSPNGYSFVTNGEPNGSTATGTNNYACVYQAYFVPTNSGTFYFAIATDDEGELWVSTNSDPSLVQGPVATVGTWTGYRTFSTHSGTMPFNMVAGQKYFMQLNFHQAGGGDNVAIAVSNTTPIANNTAPIDGSLLIPYTLKAVPMTIASQSPAVFPIYQGQDATINVQISSVPAPTYYQWYRNGQIISNANSASYTQKLITKTNDDGASFYCVVSNLVDCVTSTPSVLTVTVDPVPPSVLKVTGSATMDSVFVTFSKRMMTNTFNTAANRKITYSTSGSLSINSVVFDSTLTNAIIKTATQTASTLYTLTLTNVTDLAGNKLTNFTYPFSGYAVVVGYTFIRYYDNFGNGNVDNVYAYSLTNNPTRTAVFNTWGTPNNNDDGHYNFGAIAEGTFIAPADGDYDFWLAADDTARLFMSTNASPAGLGADYICSVTGWTPYYGITNNGSNQKTVAPITMTGGKSYFYRIAWVQGGGGGGVQVAFATAYAPDWGTAWTNNMPTSVFAASGDPTGASVNISKQPTAVTVLQGGTASFSIAATGTSSMGTNVSYQWRTNGVAVQGATSTNLVLKNCNLDLNNASVDCVVGVPFASATSTAVTLKVTADTVKPTILSAGVLNGGTQIGVRFSKPVTSAAANLTYTVDGLAVTGTEFRTNSGLDGINGDLVVLTVNNPINDGTTVNVTVAGALTDRWGNVNNTPGSVPVEICLMTAQDIGTPSYAGNTIATSAKSFQLMGGGADIWNGTDACQYVYMTMSGNFDARARVANLSAANTWSKSGLLVRADTNADGLMLYNMVAPPDGVNCWDWAYRGTATSNAVNPPNFPGTRPTPTFPGAWVRLIRLGQTFIWYRSFDGTNWINSGTADLTTSAFPTDLLVGVASTAHQDGTGIFSRTDVYDFTVTEFNPGSPKLTAVYSNGNLIISWDANEGLGLSLYWTGDIKGTWTRSNLTPTVNGSTASVTIPTVDPVRFYQLGL